MADNWAAKGWMTSEVSGTKELDRMLSVLPDQIAQKVLRGAVLAGATEMKRQAKRRCPIKSGRLRRSIRVKYKRIGRGSRTGRVFYQVGPSERYGHLVEFGTGFHVIKPSLSRRIKRRVAGENVSSKWALGKNGMFGKRVNHPGATPQPFLRPAFDEGQDDIIRAMKRRIGTGIEKEARKLARENIVKRRSARRKA